MNGTSAFFAVVAIFVVALILIWISNRYGGRKVIGRRATLSELLAEPREDRAVSHLLPPEGEGEYLTACCGRDPFDLNASREPLTIRPERMTCDGSGGEH